MCRHAHHRENAHQNGHWEVGGKAQDARNVIEKSARRDAERFRLMGALRLS